MDTLVSLLAPPSPAGPEGPWFWGALGGLSRPIKSPRSSCAMGLLLLWAVEAISATMSVGHPVDTQHPSESLLGHLLLDVPRSVFNPVTSFLPLPSSSAAFCPQGHLCFQGCLRNPQPAPRRCCGRPAGSPAASKETGRAGRNAAGLVRLRLQQSPIPTARRLQSTVDPLTQWDLPRGWLA